LSNISIVAISVGLPVAVNNPVPASQVGFNNSVQFNAFASKAATQAVIVGTSVMIWNFLLTVLSERHSRIFANSLTLSIFFLTKMGEGASQVD